jgi:hypothetical protein
MQIWETGGPMLGLISQEEGNGIRGSPPYILYKLMVEV